MKVCNAQDMMDMSSVLYEYIGEMADGRHVVRRVGWYTSLSDGKQEYTPISGLEIKSKVYDIREVKNEV